MKTRLRTAIGFAALAVLVAPELVQAQTATELRVAVPFSFKAGGTCFPAGQSTFRRDSASVSMTSAEGKSSRRLPVFTFIARSSHADVHLLVFDKVGEDKILSEVWLPGQDGALLNAQKGEHQHEIIRLTWGKKGGRN